METNFFQFSVGSFKCMAVSDGGHHYELGVFFNQVPEEQVQQALAVRGLPVDKVFTPFTCLYVDNGAQRTLIDMGGGSKMPEAGKMRANLSAGGVEPESIDAVIITHAHPDHIGGAVDEAGSLTYPNAHYYIWGQEWAFWWSDGAAEKSPEMFVDLARERLGSLKERVTLVEPGSEILPGIMGVDAAGHTPGHMNVLISSGDAQLLHISDTALTPLHLENPAWQPLFDVDPAAALASKERILDRAAAEERLLFAHHFAPFPGLGKVVKMEKGWQWQPIEGAG